MPTVAEQIIASLGPVQTGAEVDTAMRTLFDMLPTEDVQELTVQAIRQFNRVGAWYARLCLEVLANRLDGAAYAAVCGAIRTEVGG